MATEAAADKALEAAETAVDKAEDAAEAAAAKVDTAAAQVEQAAADPAKTTESEAAKLLTELAKLQDRIASLEGRADTWQASEVQTVDSSETAKVPEGEDKTAPVEIPVPAAAATKPQSAKTSWAAKLW